MRGVLNSPPTIVPGERFSAENPVGLGRATRPGGTRTYCALRHHIHLDAGGRAQSAAVGRHSSQESLGGCS